MPTISTWAPEIAVITTRQPLSSRMVNIVRRSGCYLELSKAASVDEAQQGFDEKVTAKEKLACKDVTGEADGPLLCCGQPAARAFAVKLIAAKEGVSFPFDTKDNQRNPILI